MDIRLEDLRRHQSLAAERLNGQQMASLMALISILCFYFTKSELFTLVSAVFLLLSFVWNTPFVLLSRALITVMKSLNAVVTPVFLTLIFFAVFTPWSFLYRLVHPKLLQSKRKDQTALDDRIHQFKSDDFNYPF